MIYLNKPHKELTAQVRDATKLIDILQPGQKNIRAASVRCFQKIKGNDLFESQQLHFKHQHLARTDNAGRRRIAVAEVVRHIELPFAAHRH